MKRLALAAILALAIAPASAQDWGLAHFNLPQTFIRVQPVDGDTVRMVPSTRTDGFTLRIFGLDTPETHGKCEAETNGAAAAKARLAQLVTPGVRVVSDLVKDKYGRYVAALYMRDGRNVAEVMVKEGLARFYNGVGARKGWC